jgi:hypothetical protein
MFRVGFEPTTLVLERVKPCTSRNRDRRIVQTQHKIKTRC